MATKAALEQKRKSEEHKVRELCDQVSTYTSLLATFHAGLENLVRSDLDLFASQQLKQQLYELCISVGIDPLVAGRPEVPQDGDAAAKAQWDHYILVVATQVLDLSRKMRGATGGYLNGSLLLSRLNRLRDEDHFVTREDVEAAVRLITPLNPDYRILDDGGGAQDDWILSCVPAGLDSDQLAVYSVAKRLAAREPYCLKRSDLGKPREDGGLGWGRERCRKVMDGVLVAGLAWLDKPPASVVGQRPEECYYFPSLTPAEDFRQRAMNKTKE